MKTRLFLIMVVISTVSLGQTHEKVFYLADGTKISGTTQMETDSSYVIETSLGVITINKKDIQPEVVVLTLKNGDRLQGVLLKESASGVLLKTSFGEVFIDADKVERLDFKEKILAGVIDPKKEERWYFSDERLMDIWFDPTGFTLKKNHFYFSGLSWAFGLTDKIQISTRWVNYFSQDFNFRPKIMLFKKGDIVSQYAFSVGGHFHTRGLPSKYKWVEDSHREWEWNEETMTNTPTVRDGYIHLGAVKNADSDDDDIYDNDPFSGEKTWGEVFSAFTISRLRDGGNGRMNLTVGISAIFYPGEDVAPRLYTALDIDVTKSVKVMSEVFYDPYYVPWMNLGNQEKVSSPFQFDIGFMTNKLPLFWFAPTSKNLWIGFHFQQPFLSFYWKF